MSDSRVNLKIEEEDASFYEIQRARTQKHIAHYIYCFGEVSITHSVFFEDLYMKMEEQLGKEKQITDENADILGVNVEKQSKRKF
jgi:hypothetical protein